MTNHRGDFAVEVEAAYPALVRAATVLCWSRSDAEDVVQETVVRACKSYASFRGDSSFLTWTYTILARVAQASNQGRSRCIPADYAMSQPQQLPPVDRAVIIDDDARCVIEAIRSLPERQREMVTLRFLEELSYAEIAEALAISVGTVKATIFEAKMSLRSTLAGKGIRRKASYVLS